MTIILIFVVGMGRIYTRKLGARRYRDYTPEQLQNAVRAVQIDKLTYQQAADTYNVPKRTSCNKVIKKHMNQLYYQRQNVKLLC